MMVGLEVVVPALLRCESCEGDRHDDCVRTEEGCACYANNSRHLAERAKVAMRARETVLLDYVRLDHLNRCGRIIGLHAHRGVDCDKVHLCDCGLTEAGILIRQRLRGQRARRGIVV